MGGRVNRQGIRCRLDEVISRHQPFFILTLAPNPYPLRNMGNREVYLVK